MAISWPGEDRNVDDSNFNEENVEQAPHGNPDIFKTPQDYLTNCVFQKNYEEISVHPRRTEQSVGISHYMVHCVRNYGFS